ncbi:hypothetical protein [Victivallis lenta]|uniref:hypothetical protein n=1 Tax=Victivallis lenta TaxID=2606640 RepID=UPI002357A71B|nr:hypothetical protein [Victivallis lenta]
MNSNAAGPGRPYPPRRLSAKMRAQSAGSCCTNTGPRPEAPALAAQAPLPQSGLLTGFTA